MEIDAPRTPASPVPDAGLSGLFPGRTGPKEAAAAVEGLFMSMLVGEMKKTLQEGGFFGGGPGSDVFDGMFERLMGEEMAKKGGFGLARFVEESLAVRGGQAAPQKADLEGTGRAPGHES